MPFPQQPNVAGDCLKEALLAAGIGVDIPDWFPIENVPALCRELGATWHDSGETVTVGDDEYVIAFYRTTKDKFHAAYTNKAEKLNLVGLITL